MSTEKYNYLKSLNDFELVNIFNQETSHNGWNSERGRFLIALEEALKCKGISLENVETKGVDGYHSVSFRYPVFLREREGKKTLIPITQSWRKVVISAED